MHKVQCSLAILTPILQSYLHHGFQSYSVLIYINYENMVLNGIVDDDIIQKL